LIRVKKVKNIEKSCSCGQHLRGSTMSSIWNVAMLMVALVVVRISHWLYRWSNPKCPGKLPPGSMGFPIIGETLDFFKPCGVEGIPTFVKKRMIRLDFNNM
jgi:hypothetical protein